MQSLDRGREASGAGRGQGGLIGKIRRLTGRLPASLVSAPSHRWGFAHATEHLVGRVDPTVPKLVNQVTVGHHPR